MISKIGYNNNNYRPNFNGIVRIKAVFYDGKITNDEKIINSAIRRVKKVLMKQGETAENTTFRDKLRKLYHYFDPEYRIPEYEVQGATRYRFSHAKNRGQHFFVSGSDAADLEVAGKFVGSKRKSYQMAQNTNQAGWQEGLYENARTNYGDTMASIYKKYMVSSPHTEMLIVAAPIKKGKMGLHGFAIGNDKYKLDVAKEIDIFQKMMQKKAQNEAAKTTQKIEKTITTTTPKEVVIPQSTQEKPNYFKDVKMSITEFLEQQKQKKLNKTIIKQTQVKPKYEQTDFFSKLG